MKDLWEGYEFDVSAIAPAKRRLADATSRARELILEAQRWKPPADLWVAPDAGRGNTHRPLWSSSRPFMYHCFTTLPDGSKGEAQFRELVRRGAVLAPSAFRDSEMRAHWAEAAGASSLYEIDVAAGDDAFLFWTGLHTFQLATPSAPAVAFDASLLYHTLGFRFRPHDLVDSYHAVVRALGECMPSGFYCLSDELHEVAKAGTAIESDSFSLFELWQEVLETGESRVREAKKYYPLEYTDYCREEDTSPDDYLPPEVIEVICNIEWSLPFDASRVLDDGTPPYPPRTKTPELLVDTWVPIIAAQYWRDGQQRWHPMAELLEELKVPRLEGFEDLGNVPVIAPDPWMQKRPDLVARLLKRSK